MAMLSNLAENQKLLDPFCGVGTILIEALTLEPRLCASGVDIERESIRKAISIAETANKDIQFIVGDAGQLPFADGEIDRIISNPPWGRAVGVRGSAKHSFFDELKRVSGAGVRIVLLLDAADEYQAAYRTQRFQAAAANACKSIRKLAGDPCTGKCRIIVGGGQYRNAVLTSNSKYTSHEHHPARSSLCVSHTLEKSKFRLSSQHSCWRLVSAPTLRSSV